MHLAKVKLKAAHLSENLLAWQKLFLEDAKKLLISTKTEEYLLLLGKTLLIKNTGTFVGFFSF